MEKKIYTAKDYAAEELYCGCYDFRKYILPYWKGNIVYNETVFPITDEAGNVLPLSLLYDPTEIVCVRDYTLETVFEEGRDYVLENGVLKVAPGGRIKVVDYAYMHPEENPDNLPVDQRYPHRDGKGFEYWNESAEIAKYCVAVTYIHNDEWRSVTPPSIAGDIPKTCEKLKSRETFTAVAIGDSVTQGAMASDFCHIPPYSDTYSEMLKKHLETKFNTRVEMRNKGIGGSLSDMHEDGVTERVIENKPSLVIIAYGMNDSSWQNGSPDEVFRKNITDHIDFIRKSLPECEFILVASIYGNPSTFCAEKYESHARVLHEIAGEYDGVAVCDPQEIERPFLESGRKKFLDFMGDNMVHPNDFGVRLIAQTIADAIGEA